MSIETSSSPPVTPLRKTSAAFANSGLALADFDESPPSGSSVSGSSDGEFSAPQTPADPSHLLSEGPPQRRRSATISTFDAKLLNHEIFNLSNTSHDKTRLDHSSYQILHEHEDQKDLYEPDLNGQARASRQNSVGRIFTHRPSLSAPASVLAAIQAAGLQESTEKDEDGNLDDRELRDLAREGLPSACVFVANLAATQSDEQLLQSLHHHFSKFGRLHIKIRRDLRGNPFSFCQFETDEAARAAVREGRNVAIDATGRRIRCEPAKVNRTLVLVKNDDSVFNDKDAKSILFGFGETEAIEFAADSKATPKRGLTQGKACYVRFVLRQDAVECFQCLRNHSVWNVDWTTNFPTLSNGARIQLIEIDPLSIFIGKLNPELTTEDLLRERFQQYGTILECNLLNKMVKNTATHPSHSFAFIKFSNEEDALKAIEGENNKEFLGHNIHVQKREIHKKHHRKFVAAGAYRPPVIMNGPLDLAHMADTMSGRPISLTIRDIADLAARLSQQVGLQRAQQHRHLSVASHVSEAPYCSIPDRRESFQSTISGPTGVGFHHPFQSQRGVRSNMSTVLEAPLSPRSAHAPARKIDSPQELTASNYFGFPGAAIPGMLGYPHSPGLYPPLQQYYDPAQLMPLVDQYRRQSDVSSSYEMPMARYSGHGYHVR